MLILIYVHPKYIFGRMTWEQGTGFPLTAKVMNNLLLIREKIKRAERLKKAQLLATKNGEITTYSRSVFEQRQKEARKDMEVLNS